MKCPICKKEVSLHDPYMPFCSERCKLIDLGQWADEKYVVSTPISPSEMIEESDLEGAKEDEER